MSKYSFDVVSDFDKSEMNNVFDQSKKEIDNRYDLKGTKASIEWIDADRLGVKITGDNDFHIDAILDIFRKKLASRGLSQKILDTSKDSTTSNLMVTKLVSFKKGLSQENAKKITAIVRANFPKANSQIQGDEVRVIGAKKDELQAIINKLKEADFDFPLTFGNYR